VAAASATALLLSTAPAAADSYVVAPTRPSGPYTLAVQDNATAGADRRSVTWKVKVTCPQGERYTVRAALGQYAYPAPAVVARTAFTGTCTGMVKTTLLTLRTGGPQLRREPLTDASAYLDAFTRTGDTTTFTTPDRGKPFYCYSVDVECEDATQIGPLILLK
jgi:hypothetical protein